MANRTNNRQTRSHEERRLCRLSERSPGHGLTFRKNPFWPQPAHGWASLYRTALTIPRWAAEKRFGNPARSPFAQYPEWTWFRYRERLLPPPRWRSVLTPAILKWQAWENRWRGNSGQPQTREAEALAKLKICQVGKEQNNTKVVRPYNSGLYPHRLSICRIYEAQTLRGDTG